MKLVLFNEQNKKLDIIDNIDGISVENDSVEWSSGRLKGIKHSFIIIEDIIEVPDLVSDEIISKDMKHLFQKIDLLEENKQLKRQQQLMQEAIDDLILSGGVL